jgi:hypothetical protein
MGNAFSLLHFDGQAAEHRKLVRCAALSAAHMASLTQEAMFKDILARGLEIVDIFELEARVRANGPDHDHQGPAFSPTVPRDVPAAHAASPVTEHDRFTLRVARMLVAEGVFLWSNFGLFKLCVAEAWALAACNKCLLNSWCCLGAIEVWRIVKSGQVCVKMYGRKTSDGRSEWCIVLWFGGELFTLIPLKVVCQVHQTGGGVPVRSTWGQHSYSGNVAGKEAAMAMAMRNGLGHGSGHCGAVEAVPAANVVRQVQAPAGEFVVPNLSISLVIHPHMLEQGQLSLGRTFIAGHNTGNDGQAAITGCRTVVEQHETTLAVYRDAVNLATTFREGGTVGKSYPDLVFARVPAAGGFEFQHRAHFPALGAPALNVELARRTVFHGGNVPLGTRVRASTVLNFGAQNQRAPVGFGVCSGIQTSLRLAYGGAAGAAAQTDSDSDSGVSSGTGDESDEL